MVDKFKVFKTFWALYKPKWLHLQTVWIQMRRLVWTVSLKATLFAIMLFIFNWIPYSQQWLCPNSEMEESISETQGWNGELKRSQTKQK